MADATPAADKTKSRELLDAKFGTMDPASITTKDGQDGKPYAVGRLDAGPRTFDVYARGKLIDEMKAKAAAGEPFVVQGELLAKGKGVSASAFDGKPYKGVVTEVGKTGENESGPWASVKFKAEGKDKPWSVLVTGDQVEAVKASVGQETELSLVWVASQRDGRWGSSPQTTASIMRGPKPPVPEDAPAP